MKQELDPNYDISVDNMNDMTIEQEANGFKVIEANFYSKKADSDINKNILARESDSKQIFAMTDGKFILEAENGYECDYFYSDNLNDLI